MISNRNDVQAGTLLEGRFKKIDWLAKVNEDKTVTTMTYSLDGKVFKSLSAAATAIRGSATNGWLFWSIAKTCNFCGALVGDGSKGDGTTWCGHPEAQGGAAGTLDEKPAKVMPFLKRTPNQQAVPEGHLRVFCPTCKHSHIIEGKEIPQACPSGHAA